MTSPLPLPSRRAVLATAVAAAAAGAAPRALAQQPPLPAAQALPDGQRFDAGNVAALARALAKRPYQAAPTEMPDGLRDLTYEQYVTIRPSPSALLWGGEGRGFVVEPLHRGFVFTVPVALHVVEDGVVRRVAYDPGRFEFGKLKSPEAGRDLAFSGFRVYAAFGAGQPVDFALFQGATFFSALAAGQGFGIQARGLSIRTAEARGEEFPYFRAFWIERPSVGQGALVVHALIDSESTTAALRMTLRPGETSHVDVEGTLFPRATLDHVGLAGMAASYLFGPSDRRNVDDARPGVYEVNGLLVANGGAETLWRPVQNPETLQVSAFMDRDPKGFGLMQRARDYASFQDDDQHWERRPSLWVEPLAEWGEGAVQLVEIPSDSEVNKNVIAYWRPKAPIPAASEFPFGYRQSWCWQPPHRPALAAVAGSRVGGVPGGRKRRVLVDFAGEALAAGAVPADLKASVSAAPGKVERLRTFAYPERRTLRVSFDLDPGGDNHSELRLLLEGGGQAISETWLYRWTP